MNNINDTIAAIATPNINSAIAIIRISGPQAYAIVEKIIKKPIVKTGFTFSKAFVYEDDNIIDEIIFLKYVAPKSFTGQDLIEINCHGGFLITNKILNLLLKNGAKMAQNGEFSKRAFLNNKITLRQANSINNLVFAKTETGLHLAANGIVNKNNLFFENLKEVLFSLIGRIEVDIDYPEYEEENPITFEILKTTISKIIKDFNDVILSYQKISYLYNGIDVAIIGVPNVGKSSLLNAILDKERAIVSNVAGTTRDIISESVQIKGMLLNFIDTAGICKTNEVIEKTGIQKALQVLNEADLILFLIAANQKISQQELLLLDKIKNKKTIIIKNKIDLQIDANPQIDALKISTVTKYNFDALFEKIIAEFQKNDFEIANNLAICCENELKMVKEIKYELDYCLQKANQNTPVDLLVINLTTAYKKVCNMLGSYQDLDIIDKMFKNFCLGK